MSKYVLVFYCDPTTSTEARFVEATSREMELLRLVDNRMMCEAFEDLSSKQAHIIILHYLDKPEFYETEKEFDREMEGFRDSDWDQEVLDLLTWSNKGKWDRDENMTVDNECMGAWHFYHILVDRDMASYVCV